MRSRSFIFVLFYQPFKKPTTHQKTKKLKTKKPNKKQKSKKRDCTPQVGSSGRELGLVILFFLFVFVFFVSLFFVFWILMLFSHCRKINNEPETKNLKNQKKQKKTRLHTPRGGSGRELDLVILFFYGCLVFCFFCFVFFVFF